MGSREGVGRVEGGKAMEVEGTEDEEEAMEEGG